MPRQLEVLRFFFSSPSGFGGERAAAKRVLSRLNQVIEPLEMMRCELVHFQNAVHPSHARDAQSAINEQLTGEYEVYLGLMGSRIGSRTQRAASGTIEEYETALESKRRDRDHIEIMWYFRHPAESAASTPEFAAVCEFKERVSRDGCLYSEFEDAKEFAALLWAHVPLLLKRWLKRDESLSRPSPPRAIPADQQYESVRQSVEEEAEACRASFEQLKSLINQRSELLGGHSAALREAAESIALLARDASPKLAALNVIIREAVAKIKRVAELMEPLDRAISVEADRAFQSFGRFLGTLALSHRELALDPLWQLSLGWLNLLLAAAVAASVDAEDAVRELASVELDPDPLSEPLRLAARRVNASHLRIASEFAAIRRAILVAQNTIAVLMAEPDHGDT